MEKIKKTWGWEHWFANSPLYCGKQIFVRYYEWSSKGLFHYHKIKDETFFVIGGALNLEVYEGNDLKILLLLEGESFHVKPGVKHRFSGANSFGCKFIEVSTQHFEEDSYRTELINGEWT